MPAPVTQAALGFAPWLDPRLRRLPGVQPLDPADWLLVDDAFAGQMALRDDLIATAPEQVHAQHPKARAAAVELLETVLAVLADRPGFTRSGDSLCRPDGVTVPLNPAAPLLTLGRLVQADWCLLQPEGGAHVLTGAILCFPASWRLADKIGRPLPAIHAPVPEYDAPLAARVQRLFDGVRAGAPLWRANLLAYADPTLHQPLPEGTPRPPVPAPAPYLRSERQAIARLPRTGAVVFSIHTAVVPRAALTPAQRAAFDTITARGA